MRKLVTVLAAIAFVIVVGCAGLTIAYTNSDDYNSETVPENITINGVDCSGLSYEDTVKKLTDEWNSRTFTIQGMLDENLGTFTDLGCKYDIKKQIRDIKKNNTLSAALNHYLHLPFHAKVAMKVDRLGKDFKKDVIDSQFITVGGRTESTDAYVDINDPDFAIVPEVFGTKPDTKKLLNNIKKSISMNEFQFVFDESEYYSMPKVRSTDKELLAYQQFCRKNLKQKIHYKLGKESYTISRKKLLSLMNDDMTGTANEEAVRNYVGHMAKKYDTVGESITIKSLTGKTFTVNGGTYGWMIDQEGETAQLIADINSHKDVSREPVYAVRGTGKYKSALGNTYIDVDLSTQKAIYFKNGKEKFRTNIVTGCKVTGTLTPTGTYYVNSKARSVTLKGKNADGSDYESFVNYWMGFIGGSIGFHDANWRSHFGGDIWITNGSHGCVNCPPSKMPTFYKVVDIGTPVIVHY